MPATDTRHPRAKIFSITHLQVATVNIPRYEVVTTLFNGDDKRGK